MTIQDFIDAMIKICKFIFIELPTMAWDVPVLRFIFICAGIILVVGLTIKFIIRKIKQKIKERQIK